MVKFITTVFSAGTRVFAARKYQCLALVLSLAFFFAYISVPVFTIPGNTYSFFFSITPFPELFVVFFLSVLMGILFTFRIYSWKKGTSTRKNTVLGFTGFFSGTVSSIFSTASCASCVSALFSFLGFGGVLFLIEHKWEITLVSFIIVSISLFFTSREITDKCKSCNIR